MLSKIKSIYNQYLSKWTFWKQLSSNVVTVGSSLLVSFASLNINIDWFTADLVNHIAQYVLAIGLFFVIAYCGIKNTYLTTRAKELAEKVAEEYQKEKAQLEAAKIEAAKQIVSAIATTTDDTTTTDSAAADQSSTGTAQ